MLVSLGGKHSVNPCCTDSSVETGSSGAKQQQFHQRACCQSRAPAPLTSNFRRSLHSTTNAIETGSNGASRRWPTVRSSTRTMKQNHIIKRRCKHEDKTRAKHYRDTFSTRRNDTSVYTIAFGSHIPKIMHNKRNAAQEKRAVARPKRSVARQHCQRQTRSFPKSARFNWSPHPEGASSYVTGAPRETYPQKPTQHKPKPSSEHCIDLLPQFPAVFSNTTGERGGWKIRARMSQSPSVAVRKFRSTTVLGLCSHDLGC